MEVKEFLSHDIPVSWVYVETEEDALVLGRPCGQYTTIETGRLDQLVQFESVCTCLAEQLRSLLVPYFGKALCVCGIGNHTLPHDALGPETVRRFNPHAYESFAFKSEFTKIVSVCPGVRASTNLPTDTIIAGVVSAMGAGCVLTVDASTCKSIGRLCSVIDLTSSGMRTYTGTADLSHTTIGVPVISIAVPTVIQASDLSGLEKDSALLLTDAYISEVVSPASFVIACALALVCYPELDYESCKRYIELFLHGIF